MASEKFGRYEIQAEIRRGGMSTVYRAYDPRFEREVALKVMPPHLLHDPTFEARFKREAKIIASLEHAAAVPVYDFGEENGRLYLVMRLMTGGSLEERLSAGPLPLEETTRIITRISGALDEAHRHEIVHRDLKPANILFDSQGNAFLSDFGIAKLRQASTTLTEGNTIVGTPAYMSPEQARGEKDIDGRTDIYSLGAILFEMVTGRVPYESETPTGQIVKHLTEPVPNALSIRKDLPPGIQKVIARAMAKKKDDRFLTAGEMAEALQKVISKRPVDAVTQQGSRQTIALNEKTAPGLAPRVQKRSAKGRGPIIWLPFIGAGAVILILLIVIIILGSRFLPAMLANETPTPSLTATVPLSASPDPTQTDTLIPTSTSTSPPTSESTSTPLPTVTDTPSPTQTPIMVVVVSVPWANIRTGPGVNYDSIMSVPQGTTLEVIGRGTDARWLSVWVPDHTTTGWISITVINVGINISDLQVLTAPPSPTPRPTRPPTETEPPPTDLPPYP